MADFKPSEVVLTGVPLGACFGKAEAEWAAAILVWACRELGDGWQVVPAKTLGRLLRGAVMARIEPVSGWGRNPFFALDWERLVLDGFVLRTGLEGDHSLEFTELGLSRLTRWVRKAASVGG